MSSAGFEQLSIANHCCGTLKRSKGFTVPIKIPVGSLKALIFTTVRFNLYSLDAFRRLIKHFYCNALKEAHSKQHTASTGVPKGIALDALGRSEVLSEQQNINSSLR